MPHSVTEKKLLELNLTLALGLAGSGSGKIRLLNPMYYPTFDMYIIHFKIFLINFQIIYISKTIGFEILLQQNFQNLLLPPPF